MTFHIDLPVFNYILDVIKDIEDSIKNIKKEKFLTNKDMIEANIRRLDVISNTLKDHFNNIKKYNNSYLEEFSQIKEKVTSKYFGADNNLIWDILIKDIPIFKEQILKIKEELN